MKNGRNKWHFETQCVHAGSEPDPLTGAVTPPLYLTSTYAKRLPDGSTPELSFDYSRDEHPTRQRLEKAISVLEDASWTVAFSSGMAAIDAILALLEPGDKLVALRDLYGGTWRILTQVYKRYGLIVYPATDEAEIEALLRHHPDVKMIFLESPTNPLLQVVDIKGVAEIRERYAPEALLCVDNTFATPCIQQPLRLGADLVVHSATKYIGGHSDLILGTVSGTDRKIEERLRFIRKARGAIPGNLECFLALRGIKTLHLRVERQSYNALRIAFFLEAHPAVRKVYYPGCPSHPTHHIAKKQMKWYGGIVSFSLKNDTEESAMRVLNNLKIFTLGESLGGVESLANHPLTMTHASIPDDLRHPEITPGLIRLSVGVEHVEDLIQDVSRALDSIE